MNDDTATIRVTQEGDEVVFERLTGSAPRNDAQRKLRTDFKKLDAFERQVGSARSLVTETWGLKPESIVFVDANGNELNPD
jgi:hypothetical protein